MFGEDSPDTDVEPADKVKGWVGEMEKYEPVAKEAELDDSGEGIFIFKVLEALDERCAGVPFVQFIAAAAA